MTCRICRHPERFEIEKRIIRGESFRDIAYKKGISRTSVYRHAKKHLSEILLKAYEVRDSSQGSQLLREVRQLGQIAKELLMEARSQGDIKTSLDGVSKLKGVLELLAKMSGEYKEQTQVTNILVASPEWGQLRARLMQALAPFPRAKSAVIEAISSEHAGNGTPAIDLS